MRAQPAEGVLRGQVDPSARVIWAFERAGWISDVRWPEADCFESRRIDGARNRPIRRATPDSVEDRADA
jgi:hypothetical protein